jgi:HPt (histidine-containing phosphotransfer) domain-containing protein
LNERDWAHVENSVRDKLLSAKLASAGSEFVQRLRSDAAALAAFRERRPGGADEPTAIESLQACVHKLAGAAGVFGFEAISQAAASLEDAIIERRAGKDVSGRIEARLDALLECIGST